MEKTLKNEQSQKKYTSTFLVYKKNKLISQNRKDKEMIRY